MLLDLDGELGLAPLVALVTRNGKQRCTQVVKGAGVNIESSNGGSIHVVPECQTLPVGSGVGGTEKAGLVSLSPGG